MDTARNVTHAVPYVYVQRRRAVDVLDDRTLGRARTIEFAEEIKDIAAAESLLAVSTGPPSLNGVDATRAGHIHLLRLASQGPPRRLAVIKLPKAAHGLTIQRGSLYAVDDVVTPAYAHHVDLSHPENPRLTSVQWGGVYAHLLGQTVADRWYITGTRQEGPMNTRKAGFLFALPLHPPLGAFDRDVRFKWTGSNPPTDFRVYKGFLYWLDYRTDNRVWLVRMSSQGTGFGPAEKVMALASFVWPPPQTTGVVELVGSRLFVGAGNELLALDLTVETPAALLRTRLASPIISLAVAAGGK